MDEKSIETIEKDREQKTGTESNNNNKKENRKRIEGNSER